MIVHHNGRLVAAAEAHFAADERGLSLGDGLFETIRVAGGRPLRLDAHLARLRAGAALLRLPLPFSDAALAEACHAVLDANGLQEAALRLTLTRGPGPRGLLPPLMPRPSLLVVPAPLPPPPGPVRAVIAQGTRRNAHSPLSRIKSLNMLDAVLARIEAAERGADEALLLNTEGALAEASIANLFLVLDGVAVTPPLSDGALPGVMRAALCGPLAARARRLWPTDLERASEAFLSNSLGVRPLVMVDGLPIGDGRPGPVTRAAQAIAAEAESSAAS